MAGRREIDKLICVEEVVRLELLVVCFSKASEFCETFVNLILQPRISTCFLQMFKYYTLHCMIEHVMVFVSTILDG